MKRIIFVTLAVCTLTAVFLAGCGKKSYFENRADITSENEATEDIQAENDPDAGDAADEKTEDDSPQEVIVKVYLYNDTGAEVRVEGAGLEDRSGLLDINRAGADELQTLDGIGASKAEAIISYREENGGFKKPEDIKNVSGIGDGTYEKIKDKITV